MPELARILALCSAFLMAAAFAIWAIRLRGPLLQRLDGRRASNDALAGIAMKWLIAALGVSAVAAVSAIVGWISA